MPADPVVPAVLPEVMPVPEAWAPPGVAAVDPAPDPPEVMEPIEPVELEAPGEPLVDVDPEVPGEPVPPPADPAD